MSDFLNPAYPGWQNVTLVKGPHPDGTNAWCWQESVFQEGYLQNGDDWEVGGISQVLRNAGQHLNDAVGPQVRQTLKTTIVPVMQSSGADAALEKRRAYKLLDGATRKLYPAWLDLVGYGSYATQVRGLQEITSVARVTAARTAIRQQRIVLKQALTSKQAVVGPPTQYSYRAYQAVIGTAVVALMLATDLPDEYLIRSADFYTGNVDKTTAERTVLGTDANGDGGFAGTTGLVAVGVFRDAVNLA